MAKRVYFNHIKNEKVVTESFVINMHEYKKSPVLKLGRVLMKFITLLKNNRTKQAQLAYIITNLDENMRLQALIRESIPNHASGFIQVLHDLYTLGVEYKKLLEDKENLPDLEEFNSVQCRILSSIQTLEILIFGGLSIGFLNL